MSKDNVEKRLKDLDDRVTELEDLLDGVGHYMHDLGTDLLGIDDDEDVCGDDKEDTEDE